MKRSVILLSLFAVGLTACNKGGNQNGDGNKLDPFKLAIGGENVPVGQYAQKILKYYDLDAEELEEKDLLTLGDDVKAVTTQVKQSLVSCGIIYATDAFSAKLKVAAEATPEMCGQVIYPAAVINTGSASSSAAKFLSYLRSQEAMSVFGSVGFSPVGEVPESYEPITENVNIVIRAAASLTETMDILTERYHEAHSNVTFDVFYGSSGKIQKDIIEEEAECDLFISAGKSQMDAVEEAGYVVSGSRVNMLENKVVLAVPDEDKFNITSFDKMRDLIKERL